jgi:hypothetical protein
MAIKLCTTERTDAPPGYWFHCCYLLPMKFARFVNAAFYYANTADIHRYE